ncbi:hypothetical protein [Psychrobacillus soli]|uniref:Uncharacterized protein n=1 Tax=Psychrobacillus soli TaxID=1543965 RepID=A0A544T9C4_9BACI|nr:hypothetical protein [Psychrobacillus soli]TQR14060.1 hypothetical protein FG383_11725 [Psychrobacillus soli]
MEANKMLVTKALPHDVAFLAFVPLCEQNETSQRTRAGAAVKAHRSPHGKRPPSSENPSGHFLTAQHPKQSSTTYSIIPYKKINAFATEHCKSVLS